jgi:hypothetical protein
LGGRFSRMSCFSERVVVVLGPYIDNGRSGTEAVKRIIRYISCSGSAVAFAMVEVVRCGEARRCCGVTKWISY